MSPSRFVLTIVAGCCLLRPAFLAAQDTSAPFEMAKQYSSELLISSQGGKPVPSKTYVDNDKIRNEMTMNGLNVAMIVRRDEHKIYQLILNQKMGIELAYDPNRYKNAATTTGPEGQFEESGPDAIDGVSCTKYKVTSSRTGQVFWFWLDTAQKVPVQMASDDGTMVVKWKNFKVGPQPAALFEIPPGYQFMTMPKVPEMQPPPTRPPAAGGATPPPTNSGSSGQ